MKFRTFVEFIRFIKKSSADLVRGKTVPVYFSGKIVGTKTGLLIFMKIINQTVKL
jgi:hypothetical protein